MSQAQAQLPPGRGSASVASARANAVETPLRELTLQETLRVMDIAREMRDARQSAEEMFRRDDLRAGLREKLMRQARLQGDEVSEAEIDAAIELYMERQHMFRPPQPGLKNTLWHAWVYRGRIALATVATTLAVAGAWWFFT